MSRRNRDAREARLAAAEPSQRLVRVYFRDGRASVEDAMWARSVSELFAAAPAHLAVKYLRAWPDVALGWYSEDAAISVRLEAESRGHAVELLNHGDYTPAYLAKALGCAPAGDETLRVTFLPSFHEEGIVTARRTPCTWEVEVRISRESIWYTRFSEVEADDWPRVRRTPGVDVMTSAVPRKDVADAEQLFMAAVDEVTEPRVGTDGMTVHVSSSVTGWAFEEEKWSPEKGSRVRIATELALRLAVSDATAEWLKNIRWYLPESDD